MAVFTVDAQVYNKYWVEFKDKGGNTKSLSNPSAYLSQKAMERRQRYHIVIDSTDLPVTESYVQAVQNTGVKVLNRSKWLNAVTVETTDTNLMNQVRALPFVSSTDIVAALQTFSTDIVNKQSVVKVEAADDFYGGSYSQISMVNGNALHDLGFRGEGMQIAVLDAGFNNVDQMTAFDSLRENGRLLGTWDFVHNQPDVYHFSDHGRNVLSIISGNLPGVYVGSAPRASYYLFVTEDVGSENRIEESNWIAAAEYADSIGVDLITTSLGYTEFDDTSVNYSYPLMNGHTARITRGANSAANKGMIVVSSAGNEGNSPWHYISAPADGDSVLAIGAVDGNRHVTSFSSRGPAYGGAIKPNIAGQGGGTAFINASDLVERGNGTSYSGPLMAGFAACLWQSAQDKNNMDIIHLIEQTASTAVTPNDTIGYGIPDFQKALTLVLLPKIGKGLYNFEAYPMAFPNPFTSNLSVMLYVGDEGGQHEIEVFDLAGHRVYGNVRSLEPNFIYRLDLPELNPLQPGIYIIRINSNAQSKLLRVVKL